MNHFKEVKNLFCHLFLQELKCKHQTLCVAGPCNSVRLMALFLYGIENGNAHLAQYGFETGNLNLAVAA